jgi:hypothetical protein
MRLSEMIRKPIVSADTGEQGGHVDDVLFDQRRCQVGECWWPTVYSPNNACCRSWTCRP